MAHPVAILGRSLTVRERSFRLNVGGQISTLAGLQGGIGPSGLGRVACFVVRRGSRRWSEPLLLTSRHVMEAHGARAGAPVFAPDQTDTGDVLEIDPASLAPVAEVTGDGVDGTHRFRLAGRDVADYHLDAATARLIDADAQPRGAVAFTVGSAHPHDALPHRRLAVRLLGVHDSAAGEIVAIDAAVERADGVLCPNSIVIRSRSGRTPFATEGDSGALVVDHRDRAIGMLWGVDLGDPTVAYACHVLPVLDRLDVVPSLRAGLTTLGEEA